MSATAWNPGGSIIAANAENGALVQAFTASAEQTSFTLTQFSYVVDTGSIRVYRNGVKLPASVITEVDSTHFTLTLTPGLKAGELIECSAVLGSQDAIAAYATQAAASAASAAAYANLTVKKDSDTGVYKPPVGTTAQRPASPAYGDSRVNSTLGTQEWWNGSYWAPMGGGQMLGTAATKGIFYNAQVITESVTITAGTNGGSFGPISVADGAVVTVADGSVWSIV